MKPSAPSLAPLPNPRYEAFAREIASGQSATQAYINIYGTENRRVASTGGSRLLRRKPIATRVRALQQAGAARVALDLSETLDFLARVVRTPAGEVLPSSDLCTRVKHTRDGSVDVWMPNKLASLRLSAKLQGFHNTASAARTASPARKPASSATSEPPQTGAPIILTEELREILIARISAVMSEPTAQQHPKQELPVAQEQRSTQKEAPKGSKEGPVSNPESHHTDQPRHSTLPRPKHPAEPQAGLTPSKSIHPPHPEPLVANPARLSTLNPQLSSFQRVTPEDSSTLIII